ncbi:family 78 glycoside hydrolase catalytic domain [Pseudarthrobacter sp. DSP2-3-2b1]|uniref:family 78 glycoside hydrolase catalytic domain n=1 Tax=Pseudarthrobacter sp. DSP2-3-2b1 TaxID=2804661 RepID=UPI003CEAE077
MSITLDFPAGSAALKSSVHGAWQGHWIGVARPQATEGANALGTTTAPLAFSRTLLRSTITVDSLPESAPARLAADSRYVLFVNGVEVGRGPVRSQPRRMRYDTYDLAPYLREGTNVISAIVTYYGDANAFWQPAAATGSLGTDAVFVFEAQIGDDVHVSDERWRALRPNAWTVFPRNHLDGVPVDCVDAALIPQGWQLSGFDDTAWPHAKIFHTEHIGGFARSQPPTDPYGPLLPRPIGALGGQVIAPASISAQTVPGLTGTHMDRPTAVVLHALAGGTHAAQPASLPHTAALNQFVWQHVVLDFGRVVAGYLQIDITAPHGTVIDLHYRELPHDPGVDEVATAPGGGMRYIARGHDDTYEALELHGLRYVHIIVRSEQEAQIRINAVTVRESTYVWEGVADFASDDPEIDALYHAGRRTVQLNSFDAFTDCPTREQRSWVGDGVVHQMVHLTTNSDWRLARNYVTLGNSPRPDGILPMSVVGEIESSGAFTIPDWSLHWLHGVHNMFRYTAETDFILGALPTAERILRWYADYIDECGTLSDVAEWNLVDWSSVFSTGRSSILTALWARGLREYEEMCRLLGNTASADWAHGLWENARAGFEAFWAEERGTYVDHILDGVVQPAASQAAGAAAIVSGLAPRDRWNRIVDAITDEQRLVVRSWIGGADGGYDIEKMQEQARGIQRVDWDPNEQVVRAEPFFSYVVHDAIALAGREELLLTVMRSWTKFLHDGYDTFGECWGWGTPVHGWSATPTRDLIQYVLGVTPATPGFEAARIAPRIGSLNRVRGVSPTPYGPITVEIECGQIRIDSPVPVILDLEHDGGPARLPAGQHTVPFVRPSVAI